MVGCVGDDADGPRAARGARRRGRRRRAGRGRRRARHRRRVRVRRSRRRELDRGRARSQRLADRGQPPTARRTSLLAAGDVLVAQAEIPLEALVAAVEHGGRDRRPRRAQPRAVPSPSPTTCCSSATRWSSTSPRPRHCSDLPSRPDVQRLRARIAASRAQTRSAVVTLGAAGAVVALDGRVEHRAGRRGRRRRHHRRRRRLHRRACRRASPQGADLLDAVRLGVAAGTYAVQRPGAQASYPSLSDLLP